MSSLWFGGAFGAGGTGSGSQQKLLTTNLDAALSLGEQLKTANLSAALSIVDQLQTLNLDAMLLGSILVTANLDAAITTEILKTANLNAALAGSGSETTDLNGSLVDAPVLVGTAEFSEDLATTIIGTPHEDTALGDMIVVHFVSDNGAETLTEPSDSGWNLLNSVNSGVNTTYKSWWKIQIDELSPESHVFTCGTSEALCLSFYTFRKVDTTGSPEEALHINGDTDIDAAGSDTVTCLSITPSVDNCLILAMASIDSGNKVFTPPDGMNEISTNFADIGGSGCSSSAATFVPGPNAATGAKSFSLSAGDQWISHMIAIRPA